MDALTIICVTVTCQPCDICHDDSEVMCPWTHSLQPVSLLISLKTHNIDPAVKRTPSWPQQHIIISRQKGTLISDRCLLQMLSSHRRHFVLVVTGKYPTGSIWLKMFIVDYLWLMVYFKGNYCATLNML